MKKKRVSTEQVAAVLHQAEQGVPVGELCRQVGISEQSFYRWKKVYGGLQPSEVRELKQLRDEMADPVDAGKQRPPSVVDRQTSRGERLPRVFPARMCMLD